MGTDRKVRLVANDRQNIGGRWVQRGEAFEADEKDAEDIMALGIGKRDVSHETKALSAAKAKKPVVMKPVVKRKYVKSGKYKRKDLRAED